MLLVLGWVKDLSATLGLSDMCNHGLYRGSHLLRVVSEEVIGGLGMLQGLLGKVLRPRVSVVEAGVSL